MALPLAASLDKGTTPNGASPDPQESHKPGWPKTNRQLNPDIYAAVSSIGYEPTIGDL